MVKENAIENELIQTLCKNGFTYKDIHDTNSLRNNICEHIKRLNPRNPELTSDEAYKIYKAFVEECKKDIYGGNTAYAFHKICNHELRVDNLRNDWKTSKEIYFRIMDKDMCDGNKFEVVHQVINGDSNQYRYDVTLLMNGFPIVQIELKKSDVEIGKAVEQINKYMNNGGYTDIYKCIQLFVVSNETNTYYSINNTNKPLSKTFMFRWADAENNHMDKLNEFANGFLNKRNLWDILKNYIIGYRSEQRMVVLRPYQIWAIKAVIRQATVPNEQLLKETNKDLRAKKFNGYVWHTTGSGKTLTSWKCVQMLVNDRRIDHVFFLIDRKDLDAQTSAEFKAVDKTFEVDDTPNTAKLVENLERIDRGFTITTIQKLSIAIKSEKERYIKALKHWKNKRIVFIIDECHRSQYGEMRKNINEYFENAVFIGFTGTPILEENAGGKATTAELFGKELHKYQIKDAIADKNVLGFAVEYYDTIKEKQNTENKLVSAIDTDEALLSKERIEYITKQIFKIHDAKTLNRKYTALFAVQSIKALLLYTTAFNKMNETLEPDKRLRVACIFTTSGDQQVDYGDKDLDFNKTRDDYIKMQEKYEKTFSSLHIHINKTEMSDAGYRDTLVKSLNVRKPYNSAIHVDIVIVVGIFLTGFDSKMTNTLYVDKELKYHDLIQAFSRTNRVESESKTFGNIVCFRNLKENVDKAVKLFNSDETNTVYKDYAQIMKDLEQSLKDIAVYKVQTGFIQDKSDIEKRKFVADMRKFNNIYNQARQSMEFNWDKQCGELLSKDEYQSLVGVMKDLKTEVDRHPEKESILGNIDFCMELAEKDTIDVNYIKLLIQSGIDTRSNEKYQKSLDFLELSLDKSNSETLKYNKDLIRAFIKKMRLEYADLSNNDRNNSNFIRDKFNKFINEEANAEKQEIMQSGVSDEYLDKKIQDFNIIGEVRESEINDEIRQAGVVKGIKERRSITKRVVEFIKIFKEKYNSLLIIH